MPRPFKDSLAAAGSCLKGDALKPALGEALKPVLENLAANFEQSQTAAGQAWVERKNKGDGHPLLIDTGRLISSVLGDDVGLASNSRPNEGGSSEHVRVVEDDHAYIASTVPYAATHEHGDDSRNIPQRQFMGVDGNTVDAIVGVLADAVLKRIGDELNK